MFQHDVENALREFDAAIQIDPTYPQPYYAAYYALMQAGQRSRAMVYLQRVAAQNPNDPQIQELLRAQGGASTAPSTPGALPRPPVPNLP